MLDADRLELIDMGDGVLLSKCEENLSEALANVQDGWYYEFDESMNHVCRDNTFVRLGDALADMSDLVAEVRRLRLIVDSIPDDVWGEMKTWEAMEGVIE